MSRLRELEEALAVASYVVLKYGDRYAPYLDRIEREIEAIRPTSAADRARRALEAYRGSGGKSAMRLTHD